MPYKRLWLIALAATLAAALALLLLISTVTALRPGSAIDSPPLPRELTYQGHLVDPNTGQPVADGSYTMVFTIYSAATGGNDLWTQTFSGPQAIEVADGQFTVYLGGPLAPIEPNLFPGSPRWLGMSVEGDAEMTPRTRFASVPYALRAETLRAGGSTAGDMEGTLYKFVNPNTNGRALASEGDFHVEGDTHVEGSLSWMTRTGHISIPAPAFRPYTETQKFTNNGVHLESAEPGYYYAPVNLPDHCTLTKMYFYYVDGNDPAHVNVTLTRWWLDVGLITGEASVESTDDRIWRATEDFLHPQVDNRSYTYWIHLSFINGYTQDVSDLKATAVVIEYEYTKPY